MTPHITPHGEALVFLINDVKRIEFKKMFVIKPGAFKMIEPQTRAARQGKRIKGKLLDRFDLFRPRLVVENMNHAVSDLEDVDMAGNDAAIRQRKRNLESESLLEMAYILLGESDGNFNGNGDRIVGDHEFLKLFVTELVCGDRLKNKAGGFNSRVGFWRDHDFIDVEQIFVG